MDELRKKMYYIILWFMNFITTSAKLYINNKSVVLKMLQIKRTPHQPFLRGYCVDNF